jgi:bifunctional non-homologous end joining protein LigD
MALQRKKPGAIGVKAPDPGFVEPALASSVDKVPSGERWIHEIKFDGYRVQVHLRDAAVKIFTRRGNDRSHRFRKIAADAWHVNAGSAIIDGEVVVPAADGSTDFSVLQNELKGRSTKIVLVAFDLLYLNGHDVRKLPLFERKALFKKIIAETDVQFSESFEIDGREMYKQACKIGLEGAVSKVRDSRYASGRGNSWVKVTCAQRERPCRPRALHSMARSGMESISAVARARTLSMPVRSTTALTRHQRRTCRPGSNR